ncbi:hypothetical protein [Nostoc favosum]|uniref:Uncharacterized protein n=1 Tax=Nostoc favosum CHAB5714 TaxID=2780399 RepID=A0ABS8IIK4_9NOSO|nr:hypothetical protein [Nostoc favosum]MCC5603630.1 hypothetical protein [Nostoc favosum CHAB5714]
MSEKLRSLRISGTDVKAPAAKLREAKLSRRETPLYRHRSVPNLVLQTFHKQNTGDTIHKL